MKFRDLLDLARIAQSADGVHAILKTDREVCEILGRAVIDMFGESLVCGFESPRVSGNAVTIPEQWCGPIEPADLRTLVNALMMASDEVPS
jgi:hypothetical protein